jgi:hypothetical protein
MVAVDFWYEFASTYSYPAATRIDSLAAERDVAVRWRPFLLGPIFAQAGWRDSPFNIYPAKGRYMWRDMERVCGALGLPLTRPEPFPQNSLLAARVGRIGAREFFPRRICRRIRRRTRDLGSGRDRRNSDGGRPRRGPDARARGGVVQQGAIEGGMRRGAIAGPTGRAVPDDGGRRGVLGQR